VRAIGWGPLDVGLIMPLPCDREIEARRSLLDRRRARPCAAMQPTLKVVGAGAARIDCLAIAFGWAVQARTGRAMTELAMR
jgi:hypothetical protein